MLLTTVLILHSVSVPGTGLDVKLSSQVGRPYDEAAVARDVRYLWSLGRFDDIRVEEPEPGALVFRVRPKPHLLLREVRLQPNTFGLEIHLPDNSFIDPQHAREIAVEAQRRLNASGYPAAEVRETIVPVKPGFADLRLKVIPGATDKRRAPDLKSLRVTTGPRDLCRALLVERRDAQRVGILDFSAAYDRNRGLTVQRGPVYRVGRIEFSGSHHYSELTLRRHLLLDEGVLFDEGLLRRSIARLNRANLFEPIDEKHVIVSPDPATGYADVSIRLAERKRGSWKISGPAGPMSIAGPLQASLNSRLPVWASYTVSISIFAFARPLIPIVMPVKRFQPVFALQRPFTPGEGWFSGIAIAPQLGWRNTAAGYAVTQIQQRLMPPLSGERNARPPLAVDLEGETRYCIAPKPRLALVRSGAGIALHFLGALPVM